MAGRAVSHLAVAVAAVALSGVALSALPQECPVLVGTIDFPGCPTWDVAVSGVYAYVAECESLRVIDVQDPSQPVEVGSLGSEYFRGTAVAVDGAFAYLGVQGGWGYDCLLSVIDVSTPAAPVEVGSVWTDKRVEDIEIVGGYAYLATVTGGLQIIDVTTPSSPSIAAQVEPIVYTLGVEVRDGYAYVADRGLRVIDVMTPAAPVEVGYLEIAENWTNDVAVSGNYAYVATHGQALSVIDISSPTSPVLAATVDSASSAIGLAADSCFVYAVGSALHVFDVSDAYNPIEVGFHPASGEEVTAAGGHVYVAFGDVFMDTWVSIYRGCAVFSDGFESGDTSAWTAAVP